MANQNAWRYCQKCEAMFYGGFPGKGACKGGTGGHEAQGYNFNLPHDIPATNTMQGSWRYCGKCSVMYFDGYPGKGSCAAGGAHQAAGFVFVLPHDIAVAPYNQNNWRYCQKCYAMYFDGYPTKGACPAGGGHEAQGYMFVLPYTDDDTLTFDAGPLTSNLPLGGSAHLVVRHNGDFTFSCHAHDSGFDNVHYALSSVLMSTSGIAFTFSHNGACEGTSAGLPFGTPRRDDDFTQSGNNVSIRNEWEFLQGAKFVGGIDGSDQLAAGLKGMVDNLLGAVEKELDQAAAKAIVALVGSVV